MSELVSVVIPVYNVEKYLCRCINSVLAQSYRNLEIILVDDGSTDNSPAICDAFVKKDIRIKVFHKKNGGLSDARNYAYQYISGEYVTFIDSDDWVDRFYIENLYHAIKMDDSDISCSWFINVFDESKKDNGVNDLFDYHCFSNIEAMKKMLFQDGIETSAWGKLYKANLIKYYKYPVGKLYEDIPVTYQCIKHSKKIGVIKNVDYFYFQRPNSIQNTNFTLKKLDGIRNLQELIENCKRDFPMLENAAICRYFSLLCNMIFQIDKKKYMDTYDFLWEEIKKYRINVISNKDAPKKSKMAAILSFFGFSLLKFAYKTTQWRG